MNINGKTSVLGLIGYPVEHTKSPLIHNELAKVLGINTVYVPFKVKPEQLKMSIEGAYALNIQGLNVTVPHKEKVIPYLCEIDGPAKVIGAVNTLVYTQRGYKGYNTDYLGLYDSLVNAGVLLEDKHVTVIGAGGAARATCVMCLEKGVKSLTILNRTYDKAMDLGVDLEEAYNVQVGVRGLHEWSEIPQGDIVFQTTNIGMHPDVNDIVIDDIGFFKKFKLAVDLIYNPEETLFLKVAKSCELQTLNGMDMLFHQGIRAYELWNDLKIDSEIKFQVHQTFRNYKEEE